MIEKLEIVSKDVKSFTKDEFTTLLAEQVCKFTEDLPDHLSGKSLLILELTLATFCGGITSELFDKEN